ncbi:MAG: plastocyanin/azurin family copper-binding protein [Thermoplasmata archaeon]
MARGAKEGDPRGKPSPSGIARKGLRSALITALIIASILALAGPGARAQAPLVMTMGDLFFEPGSFSIEPGENVTLRVVNGGALRHTFTLFAEADAQVPVDDNAALLDFYARSPTLVDVDLAGGQETTVNFTVPDPIGVYTYVCIVPGHSVNGMHGLMFAGVTPGNGDFFGGIGIVQGILLIALAGVAIFVVIYQIRSTRP